MGKIIGIDLGTTNSCVAVMDAGEAKVIENAGTPVWQDATRNHPEMCRGCDNCQIAVGEAFDGPNTLGTIIKYRVS